MKKEKYYISYRKIGGQSLKLYKYFFYNEDEANKKASKLLEKYKGYEFNVIPKSVFLFC